MITKSETAGSLVTYYVARTAVKFTESSDFKNSPQCLGDKRKWAAQVELAQARDLQARYILLLLISQA